MPSDAYGSVYVQERPTNAGDIELAHAALEEMGLPCQLHTVRNGEEALDFLYRRGNATAIPHNYTCVVMHLLH